MNNRLKEIRESLGLSKTELAKKANISRYTILKIEKGETPNKSDTIAKLVRALNVPANKIFFDFDVL